MEDIRFFEARVAVAFDQPHVILFIDHKVKSEEFESAHPTVSVKELVGGIEDHHHALLDAVQEIVIAKRQPAIFVVLLQVSDVFLELGESEDVAVQQCTVLVAVALDCVIGQVHVIVHAVKSVGMR